MLDILLRLTSHDLDQSDLRLRPCLLPLLLLPLPLHDSRLSIVAGSCSLFVSSKLVAGVVKDIDDASFSILFFDDSDGLLVRLWKEERKRNERGDGQKRERERERVSL